MAESALQLRLDTLRKSQNPDGGWGYYPGKKSWLEPTVYASLALAGDPRADRAWALLESWQQKDGSVRPAADVAVASWGAALLITLAAARGELGEKVHRSVNWLLGISGVEGSWVNRMAARLGWLNAERDLNLTGWPWNPNTSSWVEPTAHAIVALSKTAPQFATDRLRERVRIGRAQLLDVRCKDGGWNYGSRAALNIDLPSYPETTGLALLGLQGANGIERSIALAQKLVMDPVSPLARAWLTIALLVHGAKRPNSLPPPAEPHDLQVVALEALADSAGNFPFFRIEVKG